MAAKLQHTPGPWRYHKTNGSPTHGEHLIAGAKPGYLAEVRDCGSGDVAANGALIAAAPKLLGLLQQWAALDGGDWNVERHAREKAELLAETRATITEVIGKE